MPLSFAVIVVSDPISRQGSFSAYQFTQAALAAGHRILQVFFYGDGANHGNRLAQLPQDEVNMNQLWQTLADQHTLKLNICSGSALRRGILDDAAIPDQTNNASNLLAPFALLGLGELADAYDQADRVVVFGT